MSYRPEFAWAMAWSDASDAARPFIVVSTVALTRKDVIANVGQQFARNGEPPREGWRRAYRQGARAIRVAVSPAFDAKAAGIPVREG